MRMIGRGMPISQSKPPLSMVISQIRPHTPQLTGTTPAPFQSAVRRVAYAAHALPAEARQGSFRRRSLALPLERPRRVVGRAAGVGIQESNRLYASWVDEIDIDPLFDAGDLGSNARLRSVLCCRVLDEIVGRSLALPSDTVRPWLGRGASNALAVLFTVSDTGGVPYRFRVTGGLHDDYTMLNHGDDLRFVVGRSPTLLPEHAGFDVLDLDAAAPEARGRFGAAALATGAFPIGLAARPIARKFADYNRDDRVGFERVKPDGEIEFVAVKPVPSGKDGEHHFVAVDGGVIDNEPFELTRRFLSRQAEQNPANRNGRETRYAVVLVDPFPNRATWPPENTSDLLAAVAPTLVSMLVDQARFKLQELSLALDESVFSRFAVLPEPEAPTPSSLALPIACGALGGFSGFLHRSFRHHDYCLGRRNAQAFLRFHFCLPETNPLFAPWKSGGGNAAAWYVADPSDAKPLAEGLVTMVREAVSTSAEPDPAQVPALPVIPLTPRLRREIVLGPADRPRPLDLDLSNLDGRLGNRLGAVIAHLVEDEIAHLVPGGWLGRQALKQFLPGVLRRKAMNSIEDALAQIRAAFPA